jgi:ABC-type sulfate transport system permease component
MNKNGGKFWETPDRDLASLARSLPALLLASIIGFVLLYIACFIMELAVAQAQTVLAAYDIIATREDVTWAIHLTFGLSAVPAIILGYWIGKVTR